MRPRSQRFLPTCRVLLAVVAGLSAAATAGADPPGNPWSLRPVGDPKPPVQTEDGLPGNAIDAFLAVSLEHKRVRPAPVADRRALIRRASYGLIGLPPARALVESFVADSRPTAEAFQEVVEALLASPHYGEHWGRHWLDVVRYADTAGENSDHPLPHAWRYRNWVIDAFNRDKRYDEFVREQLAGDLLGAELSPEERNAGIIATGYLAIARRFGHDIEKEMHLTYEDVIDNLGKAFLGLSISCARCHDHKHDPITARDYYALYSVFDSTRFSFPGCEPKQQPRDLIPIASGEILAQRTAWEKERAALQARLNEVTGDEEAKRLKAIAAKVARVVSSGEVPDAGSVRVSKEPIEVEVKKGEAIQLSILPRANYGADTTILDYTLTHTAGAQTIRWSLADLLDDLLAANPHPAREGAVWCFLDTAGGNPRFLAGKKDAVEGKPALKAWENKGPPSVLVNSSAQAVKVWTTLPPRTVFCHPGPKGPVAIVWLSPVEGRISIELTVKDGHPGGDGVAWRLEHLADPEISKAYLALGNHGGARGDLESALAAHAKAEPKPAMAYAVAEGEPKQPRIHVRGNHEDPGEEIPKHYLAMLGGGSLGEGRASGRRELADRIVNTGNPLTARVMVNRIWAWHFGRGLVATPNDFGNHGAAPTHPELLDYLARYFMEHGWSVKAVHRLIMKSAAYQRSAREGIPPEMFAAFTARRLSAEELRDTLLVAAGTLDREPGRGHPFPPEAKWGFTQHNPFAAEYPTTKRSVYLMRKRNRVSRFFALFNGADPNASTAEREVTTVPTQALYFMNDPFFHDSADKFAARIRDAADEPAARLDFACREIFARPVTAAEVTAFTAFSRALAPTLQGDAEGKDREIWKAYARVLLASNELLHLD